MHFLRLGALALTLGAFALMADGARAQGASDALTKPGAHVVLALDTAEVRALWLGALRDEVRRRLREAKVGIGRIALADNVVQVRLGKPEDADAALKALADLAPVAPSGYIERVLGLVRGAGASDVAVARGEGGEITVTPTKAGLERRTSAALDDAVAIAGRRLEGMGIAATAVRRGQDQIHVHAPALESTATLRTLLTRSAQLTFHEVHATMSAEEARRGRTPTGYRIYPAPPGELLLHETPVIRGNDLTEAQASFDRRTNQPVLSFRFNNLATRTFARYTAENVGRPFAIVLDDVVLSAPVIREPILGGSGQVSGNFTVEEANQLSVLLRAGSLPAKLTVLEERVVPAAR